MTRLVMRLGGHVRPRQERLRSIVAELRKEADECSDMSGRMPDLVSADTARGAAFGYRGAAIMVERALKEEEDMGPKKEGTDNG